MYAGCLFLFFSPLKLSGNFKGWRNAAPTLCLDRMGSKEPNFHLLRTLLYS